MQQSIGVKECLANRGIPLDTTCPLCHLEVESILHALRDCNLVKPIWHQLSLYCVQSSFFSQGIRDWLISNGGLKSTQNAVGIPWNVLFSFALWWIWKQWNQVVFNSKSVNPNLSKSISSQALEFFLCASKPSRNRPMMIKQVKWERPERGWLKLNTDGSWSAALDKAVGGGLIRDEMGN